MRRGPKPGAFSFVPSILLSETAAPEARPRALARALPKANRLGAQSRERSRRFAQVNRLGLTSRANPLEYHDMPPIHDPVEELRRQRLADAVDAYGTGRPTQAELRSYNQTWRERIADFLMGEGPYSNYRARLVSGLMGTTGIGSGGIGAVDFTPAGIPFSGQEAKRAADAGDWLGATLNAAGTVPVAGPVLGAAAKGVAKIARSGAADAAKGARHLVHAPYEAQPGVGTGHLPSVTPPYAENPRALWTGPDGHDVMYSAAGVPTRPTLPATGSYRAPGGPLETNPAAVAKPMMELAGEPGAQSVHPASRAVLNAVEAARAALGVQNAGGWWTRVPSNDPEALRSLFLPYDRAMTAEQIRAMDAVGAKYGLPHVVDSGEGVVLTNFHGNLPSAADLKTALKGGLAKDLSDTFPGVKPQRAQIESGYVGFEDAWRAGEGSGAVTRMLQPFMENPAAPGFVEKLDASPALRQRVMERLEQDANVALNTGAAVREDVQLLRHIVAEEGFSGLFRALAQGAPLPAVLVAPVLQAAQWGDQDEGGL
jgi:hypothetical protein